MKVSIIIVHYKVKEALFNCLESIYSSTTKVSYEVIVVDNDEEKVIEKELKKKFPKIVYIKSKSNVGFGAGNNLGVQQAKGEYLFFLNPDTEIEKGSLTHLVNFMQADEQVGIVAPLLLDKHNYPYPLQGTSELSPLSAIFGLSFLNTLFPKNPISKKYWLHGWNKKETKEVDVVPGTAFVIRKKAFVDAGGFDEKFFLFFEENDLCKRIKQLGHSVYINPEARVMHSWGESTKQRNDSEVFFAQSRFYYMKKHYGLISAILVTAFLKMNKELVLLFLILLLGAAMRLYRIEQTFIFSGEVGHNLLAIKNAFVTRQLPLIGPPTSHPWLSFGPLFYWIYGPVLLLSKFNPLSHAYFGVFISLGMIVSNYYVVKRFFSSKVALFSSYLMAISPLFLSFTRGARFFFIVTLLSYPFLFFLIRLCNGNRKYFFHLSFVFGCMLSFHFSPLMLLPFVVVSFILYKVRITKHIVLSLLCGFFVPMLPFFLYDIMHKLSMTKNLLLWIPYRVAGFFGLYPKNTVSEKVLHENVLSLVDFFITSFTPTNYAALGYLILVVLLVYSVIHFRKLFLRRNPMLLVYLWLLCGYLAAFIHGSPPIHYFVPLLPIPIILFAYVLADFWNRRDYRIFVPILLLIITVFDGFYYFSPQWFYQQQTIATERPFSIPYPLQQKVARTIVKDSNGEQFQLHRVGLDDQFEGDYAQNYIYLLWLYGNEPVQQAETTYVIVEQPSRIGKQYAGATAFLHAGNILIIRIPTILLPISDHLTMR
jgi:N-acetylglucosaminyl-diphospho-decaprenol L-rhamnosyltransferase